MKTILTILILVSVGSEAMAYRVDRRQNWQDARIDQGVQSGALTPGESLRLQRQQAGIAAAESRAQANGHYGRVERRRIEVRQDRASQNIYRLKHN